MAADADGHSWRLTDGGRPDYPLTWARDPQKPNHENGQNVMYFDGHIKWMETNYASDAPDDNIYAVQGKDESSSMSGKGGRLGRAQAQVIQKQVRSGEEKLLDEQRNMAIFEMSPEVARVYCYDNPSDLFSIVDAPVGPCQVVYICE